jgi:ubiquinone/menaquinone biosynthesis C-methylase UbiE
LLRVQSRASTVSKAADRDVGRFDEWAPAYDHDRLQQRFFGPVHGRTLELAAGVGIAPQRVLDIGCGTGSLLRSASVRWPGTALAGVDPAAGMLRAGRLSGAPIGLVRAIADALPFADATFDLVVSTVSFHHWARQSAGLAEVGRVLAPGGIFVLADLHAVGYLRVFYALARRRGRMHTPVELAEMLAAVGLDVQGWAPVFDLDPLLPLRRRQPRPPVGRMPLVTAVIARRQPAARSTRAGRRVEHLGPAQEPQVGQERADDLHADGQADVGHPGRPARRQYRPTRTSRS